MTPFVTASDLIRRAFFLAEVLDPNERVDPSYIKEGFQLLNEIINQWSSLGMYIPYTSTVPVSLLPNIFQYPISPEIIEVQEANILDTENILSPIAIIDTNIYNALNFPQTPGRPNQLWVADNQNFTSLITGQLSSLVYVYPMPDTNYTLTMILKQKFVLTNLYSQMTNIPSYYIKALRYQLASDISDIYGTLLGEKFTKTYEKTMQELAAANPIDWSMNVNNVFRGYRRYRPWGKYYVG